MIIGKQGEQSFIITDNYVSRRHCEITKTATDNKYHIKDLGSSNGTFVNGLRVAECDVTIADKIMLGNSYALDLTKLFPPPPPPGIFPPHLKKIYTDYNKTKSDLRNSQRKKQNFRMLFMSASSLIAVLTYFGLDQETARIITVLFSIAAFVSLLTMIFGSDKTERELEELNNQFQQKYVDGNCNRFLGNYSPDYIQNNLNCNCPSCRKPII
ncbi:MAG: FHA domain-containing protein [Bacteroidales bacterium]|nr:FHA domain-containing protein [Bacteroidales bacterium]